MNVDPSTGDAGKAAGKALEGTLNKYDKAVNSLSDKAKLQVKSADGKAVSTITGKEFKSVWNGTSFSITSNEHKDNGGVGGGTADGHAELTPGAVSNFESRASSHGMPASVGHDTLVFHEIGHETKYGVDTLRNNPPKYTGFPSWPAEIAASEAGRARSSAVGGEFSCQVVTCTY